MIWILLTSILWSSVSGISEYHRMKDRALSGQGNERYKYHSEQWHKLEFFDAALAIGTGVAIGFDINENNIWVGIADVLVISALRWNIRDGVQNMKNGNNFFYRSPNTTSSIEYLGTPLFKLGFLTAAILINFIVRGL